MKFTKTLSVMFLLLCAAAAVCAQEKGVDTQSQKVRDTGSSRSAGVNGNKTDVGTAGSGINFGKGKTKEIPALPNPYRVTARRDELLKTIADLMRDRKLIVDDAASRPNEGIIVTQPFTFIRGAVVGAGHGAGRALHLAEPRRGIAAARADRIWRGALADHAGTEDTRFDRRAGEDAHLR